MRKVIFYLYDERVKIEKVDRQKLKSYVVERIKLLSVLNIFILF